PSRRRSGRRGRPEPNFPGFIRKTLPRAVRYSDLPAARGIARSPVFFGAASPRSGPPAWIVKAPRPPRSRRRKLLPPASPHRASRLAGRAPAEGNIQGVERPERNGLRSPGLSSLGPRTRMMTFRRPFPGGAGGIPLSTLTNGPFGRSATDTDLICLWKGWNFLCTSAAGRMPKEPLAGYTAYGTRMVTAYGFSLDGRVPQSAFCTQVGPAAWSGLFVVPPDKKRAGSQAGGSPPGSVGIRILRTLGEGWSEKIRLEGYGVVPRRVLLELTWAAPLDDVAPALERRGESGWSGGSR